MILAVTLKADRVVVLLFGIFHKISLFLLNAGFTAALSLQRLDLADGLVLARGER